MFQTLFLDFRFLFRPPLCICRVAFAVNFAGGKERKERRGGKSGEYNALCRHIIFHGSMNYLTRSADFNDSSSQSVSFRPPFLSLFLFRSRGNHTPLDVSFVRLIFTDGTSVSRITNAKITHV